MRKVRSLAFGGTLVALALVLLSGRVAAHESRDIADGQYNVVIGFLDEPAYAGQMNGLSLRVTSLVAAATPAVEVEDAPATPVEGLETTLQAEVFYTDQTMPLILSAAYNDPGHYESVFFPTQPGDYSFHIFGTIDGVAVDETFTSGPETFSTVQDPAPLQFPKETAANSGEAVSAASLAAPAGSGDDDGFAGSGLLFGAGAAGVAGLWGLGRLAQSRRLMAQVA